MQQQLLPVIPGDSSALGSRAAPGPGCPPTPEAAPQLFRAWLPEAGSGGRVLRPSWDPRPGPWLRGKEAGTLRSPGRAQDSASSEKTAGRAEETAGQMRKSELVLPHPGWPQAHSEAKDDLRVLPLVRSPLGHCDGRGPAWEGGR